MDIEIHKKAVEFRKRLVTVLPCVILLPGMKMGISFYIGKHWGVLAEAVTFPFIYVLTVVVIDKLVKNNIKEICHNERNVLGFIVSLSLVAVGIGRSMEFIHLILFPQFFTICFFLSIIATLPMFVLFLGGLLKLLILIVEYFRVLW